MSHLVRSTPVMILIPDGRSVGGAMQRVPIAALRLARNFEWFGIPGSRPCGCPGRGHQRAGEVRIDRRRPSEALRGAAAFRISTEPLLWRDTAPKTVRQTCFRSVQTAFPWLARHFHRAKVRQTAGLRRFSKNLSCKCRSA